MLPDSHTPPLPGYASAKSRSRRRLQEGMIHQHPFSPPPGTAGSTLPQGDLDSQSEAASGVRTAGPTVGTVGLARQERFKDLMAAECEPVCSHSYLTGARTLNSATKPAWMDPYSYLPLLPVSSWGWGNNRGIQISTWEPSAALSNTHIHTTHMHMCIYTSKLWSTMPLENNNNRGTLPGGG